MSFCYKLSESQAPRARRDLSENEITTSKHATSLSLFALVNSSSRLAGSGSCTTRTKRRETTISDLNSTKHNKFLDYKLCEAQAEVSSTNGTSKSRGRSKSEQFQQIEPMRRRRQFYGQAPLICAFLILGQLALLVSSATTSLNGGSGAKSELKLENVAKSEHLHRVMSDADLRRTFQVENHDQVPEYQVLEMRLHRDGSHLISPVEDLSEILERHKRSSTLFEADEELVRQDSKQNQNRADVSAAQAIRGDDAKLRPKDQEQLESDAKFRKSSGRSDDDDSDNKSNDLIVMKLSTFGKKFQLRLKRNADFQQRIQDMKMFLAESTRDGRLRYTEIKQQQQAQSRQQQQQDPKQQQQQQQEQARSKEKDDDIGAVSGPSKKPLAAPVLQQQQAKLAAAADEQLDIGRGELSKALPAAKVNNWSSGADSAAKFTAQQKPSGSQQPKAPSRNEAAVSNAVSGAEFAAPHKSSANFAGSKREAGNNDNLDDIGHSYHDEANLAALLIERDPKTGKLRLDGTIGNDFVIKPLPAATLDALLAAKASKQAAELSWAASSARRKWNDTISSSSSQQPPTNSSASQLERAYHMHDDDPHDDDEMFLDEDEALEMAHLRQQSSSASSPSNNGTSAGASQQQQAIDRNQQIQALGKVASERKWRKYRKLMAQTQVPKQGEMASESNRLARRAKRDLSNQMQQELISHHIIFRQKPSNEGSSSEHKHSFMMDPSELAFEMAAGGGRLAANGTDEADDPLGGQFFLEPALASLNSSDSQWKLINGTNQSEHHRRFKRHLQRQNMRHGAGGGRRRQERFKRQAPDTVWPEVLLVVDYDSFLLHGGDSRDVKRYFVSFWNGVDLRYKLLVHPHIRISLAGMIVAKDRDATPYLERNRLRAPNADAVDAAGALTDMGKYLYREDRLPTYDLAVVITKLDMCRRRFEGGRCNRGTAGFAYVGGACVVNKRLEKVNSVAIIEDSGGFSGIIVAAHEVGHLLGCVHDGSPPPSYLGGPGATHCPWEDGFIMSDLRHTERGFRWSQCSVEQFKHFLHGETATCLYNYPHESQLLHRLLPGTMLTLDDQCKRDRGTNACFKDARVCAQLFCFDSASGYCVSYRPAAEGSPCGEGQVCRNGKCVAELENIIPDYSHQSQTVLARRQPTQQGASNTAGSLVRLTDNGLSASTTSAATSSPDAKLSSRLDSFPLEGPLLSPAPPSSFGGRQVSAVAKLQPGRPQARSSRVKSAPKKWLATHTNLPVDLFA